MDDLDKKLQEAYKSAGENTSKVLDAYFPNKDELVNWFYDSSLGKSPRDLCKEGKQDELESILICLAQGNIGS